MKRCLTCLLAAILLLSLCACGVSEEDARAIELYRKYAHIIDRLEEQDYPGAVQEVAVMANAGKEQEEKTPMAELLQGQWYLSDGEEKLNPAEVISVSGSGTVTLDGVALTWMEHNSGGEHLNGYLLKDGVHTYAMEICKYRDDKVPYIQVWTVEADGDRYRSDDWVGTYYKDPMLGILLNSWQNLDNSDAAVVDYFSINRSEARVNDAELDWSVTASGEDSITVDVGGVYTLSVELRGERPIAFLTESSAGVTEAYYDHDWGYDNSWPEYIYPRAVKYLNECVEDLERDYTPGFWDNIPEESKDYSGNAAWKRLYELFTQLGDYRDSAELAARFTILEDQCIGADVVRVDNMGNESTGTYEAFTYDSLGRMVEGRSNEIFRLYGTYENSLLFFFYDADGRISKVQRGSGNNISVVITPAYDEQGRMVSAAYQSNSVSRELSYRYDEQGRLAENTVWDGSDRYQYTYTYDAEGRLVKQVCWYGWNEPDYNHYRYTTEFTYDGQGFLIGKVTVKESYSSYRKEFTLSETTTISYETDGQGRPVSATITVEKGDGSSNYASQNATWFYEDLYFFE